VFELLQPNPPISNASVSIFRCIKSSLETQDFNIVLEMDQICCPRRVLKRGVVCVEVIARLAPATSEKSAPVARKRAVTPPKPDQLRVTDALFTRSF
jgi:hypothetical protein